MFTLTISLANADARLDGSGAINNTALAGYVMAVSREIENGRQCGNVRDANGNTIGHWDIED